jgi:hypothetical protein
MVRFGPGARDRWRRVETASASEKHIYALMYHIVVVTQRALLTEAERKKRTCNIL